MTGTNAIGHFHSTWSDLAQYWWSCDWLFALISANEERERGDEGSEIDTNINTEATITPSLSLLFIPSCQSREKPGSEVGRGFEPKSRWEICCRSLSLSLPFSLWLCGIELLIRIVARPNQFRPSSFCNGAADPKLWALILLSSVWWKITSPLFRAELCLPLINQVKKRWSAQWAILFYFFFLPFFFSFEGMHMHINHFVTKMCPCVQKKRNKTWKTSHMQKKILWHPRLSDGSLN